VVGELDGLAQVVVGDFDSFVRTDAGAVYRWSEQAPLTRYQVPQGTLAIGFYTSDLVALTASHQLHWRFGQIADHVLGFSNRALLFEDGGVTVPNGTSLGEPLPLPRRAIGVSEGCALLETGVPSCFGARGADGGVALTTPAGLRPFARQVIGTLYSGCILYGSNGVQCWGDNYFGQLGVQGPGRSSAVDIVIPEPIERLATSDNTLCAYTTSKKLLCWGDNSSGQLGFKRPQAFLPVLR
jgi:hypothetical protein